jgi:hypothetical protein
MAVPNTPIYLTQIASEWGAGNDLNYYFRNNRYVPLNFNTVDAGYIPQEYPRNGAHISYRDTNNNMAPAYPIAFNQFAQSNSQGWGEACLSGFWDNRSTYFATDEGWKGDNWISNRRALGYGSNPIRDWYPNQLGTYGAVGYSKYTSIFVVTCGDSNHTTTVRAIGANTGNLYNYDQFERGSRSYYGSMQVRWWRLNNLVHRDVNRVLVDFITTGRNFGAWCYIWIMPGSWTLVEEQIGLPQNADYGPLYQTVCTPGDSGGTSCSDVYVGDGYRRFGATLPSGQFALRLLYWGSQDGPLSITTGHSSGIDSINGSEYWYNTHSLQMALNRTGSDGTIIWTANEYNTPVYLRFALG